MKNRAIKLIICFAIVCSLMVGFCTSFASAEPVWLLRAKAALAATATAAQLVLNPVGYVLEYSVAQSIDPLGIVETIGERQFIDYLDRSVIKVMPDVVTIDGVAYSDIWLGPEAASTLRTDLGDFISAYNLVTDQSLALQYAQGVGYNNGVPLFNNSGSIVSQAVYPPLGTRSSPVYSSFGDFYFLGYTHSNNNYIGSSLNDYPASGVNRGNRKIWVLEDPENDGTAIVCYYAPGMVNRQAISTQSYSYTSQPFSFDYTSGDVFLSPDEDEGLLIRVPSTYDDGEGHSYDIPDFVNDYPDINQPGGRDINIDPSLNPNFQTDIDIGNGIGDLLLTIFGLDLLNKIINFAPEPTDPEPGPEPAIIDPLPDPDPAPDEPTSGTTIADTDWTKLDELLRWIQSTIDSIRHITESLQTMLDSLFDQLQEIIQSIQSLPEQLLEDIETGPSKVFRKALDVLKSLFLPLLLPIKAMMGLWHYVVEWLASVNAPFMWIFGIMNGTSYNMVLPIYAVLAGSICIAIYKVLGR